MQPQTAAFSDKNNPFNTDNFRLAKSQITQPPPGPNFTQVPVTQRTPVHNFSQVPVNPVNPAQSNNPAIQQFTSQILQPTKVPVLTRSLTPEPPRVEKTVTESTRPSSVSPYSSYNPFLSNQRVKARVRTE